MSDTMKLEAAEVYALERLEDIHKSGLLAADWQSELEEAFRAGQQFAAPRKGKAAAKFVPPTVGEVEAYCRERSNGIDAEGFVAHYEARNWKPKGTQITNWKACVITFEKEARRRGQQGGNGKPQQFQGTEEFQRIMNDQQ